MRTVQVLLLNIYNDLLVVLTADCHITVYFLSLPHSDRGEVLVLSATLLCSRRNSITLEALVVTH